MNQRQENVMILASNEPEHPEETSEISAPTEGNEKILDPPGSGRSLTSIRPGDSEVEQLAHRIESRRMNKILITRSVRADFLVTCKHIAEAEEYQPKSKIPLASLIKLRDEVKEEFSHRQGLRKRLREFLNFLRFYDETAIKLQLLERGIEIVNKSGDDWFYYHDFIAYYTRRISMWPWMRNETLVSFVVMFFFYLFTPIWFCHIVPDRGVCPSDPTDQNRSYYGWLTSLYFASTTMTTVGYGDVAVQTDNSGIFFVGIGYIFISLYVGITAFSAAAADAFSPFAKLNEKILHFFIPNQMLEGKLLHQQIRRVKIVKISEFVLQFLLLNLIGMLLAYVFVRHASDLETTWSWMESFYWAVQTTTTIGYGDLDMPFDFRWFQVFFLISSTYFVGNAFGKLGRMKQEILNIRRHYAWQRRVVSKTLIDDMDIKRDDKVDQYEYVVASLLELRKIELSDITPIMNRFRELAGDSGYIQVSETNKEESDSEPDYGEDTDHVRLSAVTKIKTYITSIPNTAKRTEANDGDSGESAESGFDD